jgi:Methylpurine-DNA glycosylase (MPG)
VAETRLRVLDRAELPVDTVQLARFLIGKMLERVLAAGVESGRIVETEAYGIGELGTPTAAAIGRFSSSAGTLSRLWELIDAQRLERNARRRRRRLDQGDRAD